MQDEYLLVLPIDPAPVGVVYPRGQSLPLHCTVMHWFRLPVRSLERPLDRGLADIVKSTTSASCILVSEKGALFGPSYDVPVHVLRRTEGLTLLHTRIFKFLAEMHRVPQELRWIGAGYRPHVTTVADRSLLPGATHLPEHLTLVRRDRRGMKKIIKEYRLELPA